MEKNGRDELCQIENAQAAGTLRRPGSLYVPWRIFWNMKQHGFRYAVRLTARAQWKNVRKRLGLEPPCAPTPRCDDAMLNLQPGEWVEVKTLEEIQRTLDPMGRNHGLVFTPEMKKHLGKRYRVYKRLELMFDEYHKSQRRLKNTVLLENVVCEGTGLGCDRSCFLYWREAWLRRCDPTAHIEERLESAAR
jgi:hypothetical protein